MSNEHNSLREEQQRKLLVNAGRTWIAITGMKGEQPIRMFNSTSVIFRGWFIYGRGF